MDTKLYTQIPRNLTHAKYTYFHKRIQYSFIKKYMIFINNTHFQAYTHLGSENIGQIWICPIITFYQVVSFHHVESFVLLIILIIIINHALAYVERRLPWYLVDRKLG